MDGMRENLCLLTLFRIMVWHTAGWAEFCARVGAIDHRKALNAATIDVQLTANTPIEVIRYIDEYVGSHTATVTQITMANREDMIAAQKNPEKYKDLVVRVTGFSARFIALDRQVQDEIINRCYWA